MPNLTFFEIATSKDVELLIIIKLLTLPFENNNG